MKKNDEKINFANLYDEHPEYVNRRSEGTYERIAIDLEVKHFKGPNYVKLIKDLQINPNKIVEIGCGTGELIAFLQKYFNSRCLGVDISPKNIDNAIKRFPKVNFLFGNFADLEIEHSDIVILSDVLEHVENDVDFLKSASQLANYVILNIPIEDNWLYRHRVYGPDDFAGHLRRYSPSSALRLVEDANLSIMQWRQEWIHESPADHLRRRARHAIDGNFVTGNFTTRVIKHLVIVLVKIFPTLGRKLYPSSIFILAYKAIQK